MSSILKQQPKQRQGRARLLFVSAVAISSLAVSNALQPPKLATGGKSLSTGSSSTSARKAVAVPMPGTASTFPPLVSPKTNDDSAALQKAAREAAAAQLPKEDAWVAKLDYEGFGKEVTKLGRDLIKEGGDADVKHLNKIVAWRNACAVIGLMTVWMTPNPLTVAALSTWTYASWAMIAHHTCHGGYNRVNAGGFNSRGFALGSVWQRAKDWLDWMHPEAWNVEHNRLHHYRLNEGADPDLVQRNLEWIRDLNWPLAAKYALVSFFVPIWKWAYYAPNTFKHMKVSQFKKDGKELPEHFDQEASVTVTSILATRGKEADALRKVVSPKEFITKVVGPFFVVRFLLIPGALLAVPTIGPKLALHAIINLALAELLTNIHAFVTIVTNHAGEDLYTFNDAVKPKTGSFYVRQIVGSANYAYGTDPVDFAHGWLNYQIEHHVWPDLSMLQYQKGAPKLKAICEKYGVPYVQESVWTRLRKTLDIIVGKSTMRTFPTQFEPAKEKAGVAGVTWKSTNGAIDEE